jgi:hypothetical protein
MTNPISWKLPALGALAFALCSAPASAMLKPAALGDVSHSVVLVQQQAEPAADEQQKPAGKKQAKKKKMTREEDAKAKARKYLPAEYHQYIPK